MSDCQNNKKDIDEDERQYRLKNLKFVRIVDIFNEELTGKLQCPFCQHIMILKYFLSMYG